MNTLYLECYSGISGDMAAGALIDLGVDKEFLLSQLHTVPLEQFEIEINKTEKQGVCATAFDIHTNHSVGEHSHEHCHEHAHSHHEHTGRCLADIEHIIDASKISEKAKEIAKKTFHALAQAEGFVHKMPANQVHFQEVGSDDSILDIIAVAVCLDFLHIDHIICSPLYEGTGFTKCHHGLTPVPTPCTLRLVQSACIPMRITENKGEMITPTGAAIIAALANTFVLPKKFTINKVGIGAGKKEFTHPNVVRAMIISETIDSHEDEICILKSSIDDSTPEQLSYCHSRLLELGAADVYFTPIYMKKNRPAYELTVLCQAELEQIMTETIFKETTAIGLRKTFAKRNIMSREIKPIQIGSQTIDCKICTYHHIKKYYVEYESAAKAARILGESLEETYRKVYTKIHDLSKMQDY